MKTLKLTPANTHQAIKETLSVLKKGGLVVSPSDTVYGLLADASNPKAIDKLLSFKDRPVGKAISVFVSDKEMAEKYIEINENAQNVFNHLLPGPFTVVCKAKKSDLDPRLFAENNTLGIRIPNFPFIIKLVQKFGKPITATSANLSGNPPVHSIPTLINTLSPIKKPLLNLIIDAGKLPKNKPSTVIDTTTGQLKTLRIGDLLPETPNSLISNSEKQTQKLAQFLLTKSIHKSFSKPLVFLLDGNLGAGKTIFTKGLGKALAINQEIISPSFSISYEYPIPQKSLEKFFPKSFFKHCSFNKKPLKSFDTEKISLNISKNINKPKKLVHFDLFRLETKEELKEINFLQSIYCGNIYVIEWPNRIPEETISALKNIAEIVYVKIEVISDRERKISWNNL